MLYHDCILCNNDLNKIGSETYLLQLNCMRCKEDKGGSFFKLYFVHKDLVEVFIRFGNYSLNFTIPHIQNNMSVIVIAKYNTYSFYDMNLYDYENIVSLEGTIDYKHDKDYLLDKMQTYLNFL